MKRPLLSAALAAFSFAPFAHAEWPQAKSDLKADSTVRFGELVNGMRYAIKKNALPTGQVSLRLRIHAGALQEQDSQQGLAHFVEHMAFHGSTHVPSGEVEKSLERLGLKMGADTNAFTSATSTVYKFDLAKNDDESVNTGLMLMRETCNALALDEKAFDTERGVMLSEMRLGDNPATRMSEQRFNFLLPGQLVTHRRPIGKSEVLQKAPVTLAKEYYDTWYRPERATLIVVGDIDVDAMEKRIQARFSDWKSETKPRQNADLGTPGKRGAAAAVYSETGAPPTTSITWVRPFNPAPDTLARRREILIPGLGLQILNRRLQDASAAADRKFTGASASVDQPSQSAEMTSIGIAHEAGKWKEALKEVERIRRQIVEQGVQQAEVDRELKNLQSAMEMMAKMSKTMQTPQLAGGILGSVEGSQVFMDTEAGIAIVKSMFDGGMKASVVTEGLRKMFEGSGPLAFVSSPTSIEGGDKAVLGALMEAESGEVDAAAVLKDEKWPYTDFGKPGTVAERNRIEDLDITMVRYSNGVRLNFKPTKFTADQVLVTVRVGNGRLDWPAGKMTVSWAAESGAFMLGGLNKITKQATERALSGKMYAASFGLSDEGLTFGGSTRPADLDTMMQVIAAYVTDPAMRGDAFEQVRSSVSAALPQFSSTPGGVYQANAMRLLHNGDRRWGFPTIEEVKTAKVEEMRALLGPQLADGPIEVSVVGDVTLERVMETVGATLGALPTRTGKAKKASVGDIKLPPPSATPVVLEHQGKPEQGIVTALWPATDFYSNLKSSIEQTLLASVMQDRLKELLRERAGTSYSVSVNKHGEITFPGYGFIQASADIPPAKASLFFDGLAQIAADLKKTPPTVDELNRARNPMITGAKQAQQGNGFWLGIVVQVHREPRALDMAREPWKRHEAVTVEDVQKAAQAFLAEDKIWSLVVQAAAATKP